MNNGESSYRRFLAGDNEGLHEIICTYRAGLILYLNSFVQNVHTAEELTEDTFLELMIKRPKFLGKSSFKTWLYAIGRNIMAKYLRSHTKLSVVPLESQEYLADEENIESNYIKNEQKRMMHQALHRLKLDYRQVLYLIYFEGFSNTEAGLIMKKSDRQVRDLLYNAKKALKSELQRSGFDYEE
ncbi:MAG: sigma-70 family RNA polymerase sigma factor [Ruminococcus sp.]|nr:sigma-70 family RNA polymerase sigma factor [Ruminococcus sp.]